MGTRRDQPCRNPPANGTYFDCDDGAVLCAADGYVEWLRYVLVSPIISRGSQHIRFHDAPAGGHGGLSLFRGGPSWSISFFAFAKLATEATCRSRTGRNRADGLQQGIMEATL